MGWAAGCGLRAAGCGLRAAGCGVGCCWGLLGCFGVGCGVSQRVGCGRAVGGLWVGCGLVGVRVRAGCRDFARAS
eukprot:1791908-Rhodomonas_salina.1